jgi:hypothetical protein
MLGTALIASDVPSQIDDARRDLVSPWGVAICRHL